MIDTALESFRIEEATRARDLAYLMEDMDDDLIDECVEISESGDPVLEANYDAEDPELKELLEHMDDLPDTGDEEIQRILEATEDGLTFDQMIGLEPVSE